MVAETIDRLQNEYAMGGFGGGLSSGVPPKAPQTIVSDEPMDPAADMQLKSSEDFHQLLGNQEGRNANKFYT